MNLGDEHAPRSRRERYSGHRARQGAFLARFFGTRRRTIVSVAVLLVVPIVLVQLFWSPTSLLPNTYVGSVNVSSMKKEEAATKLDQAYADTTVPLYFSDSDEVVTELTLGELGYTVNNAERVDAYSYPFIARLVPYSLFMYPLFMDKGEPTSTRDENYAMFVEARFGADCNFEPRSATIMQRDGELAVQPASRGGSCNVEDLQRALAGVTARLDQPKIELEGTSTAPSISTAVAEKEYDRITKELSDGVTLKVKDDVRTIDAKDVTPWVTYSEHDGALQLTLASDAVAEWLERMYGEAYNFEAGTTVVNLRDYKEASRESGKNGSQLNTTATTEELTKDLRGEKDQSILMIETLQPNIEYTRSYSPSNAALSAVMKKYADTHSGVYGVKMVELSGDRRNAAYDSTRVFTTASTYKMFVAYSVLLRIESGEMTWDQPSYGGLSVSTCFDRMLKLSNNECAVWFLLKISYPTVTAEAHAIGATHTNFIRSSGISSTADDEAHLLSLLYTGQILRDQATRDRWVNTMKGNVYVAGIPTGIPDAVVADKVGFMDGLLHDAAIVYSKKGDYVLIILTDGASWASIAELAKEIEAAR